MKSSNLAECLEEFEAAMVAAEVQNDKQPHLMAAEDRPRRARLRLSLDSRRIEIRDMGLPHFRIF